MNNIKYFLLGIAVVAAIVLLSTGDFLSKWQASEADKSPISDQRQSTLVTPANDTPTLVEPPKPEVIGEDDKRATGVYFLDLKAFEVGIPPFEKFVTRDFDQTKVVPVLVLTELFKGPTPEEKKAGLATVLSEARSFYLTISKGVGHVYLKGGCNSQGATYNIASLIVKNLKQFERIKSVKIYDPEGKTQTPDGPDDSIPTCLEP